MKHLEVHLTCWACGAPLEFPDDAQIENLNRARIVGRCTDAECPTTWLVDVRLTRAKTNT